MTASPALAPPPLEQPAVPGLQAAVDRLPPVDAALLARSALLRREDTKLALPAARLPAVLAELAGAYGALAAGDTRLARYDTVYHDGPGLPGYHAHLFGRVPRYKLRVRHYLDRHLSVVEIKVRTSRVGTDKLRREHPFGEQGLSGEEQAWALAATGWQGPLAPQARTAFLRLTLVGLERSERVTLDLGLHLERGAHACCYPGLVVAEVKQARLDQRSPALLALRRAGAVRLSVSKYLVALARLGGQRNNNALPTLRRLERYAACQS